MADQLGGWSGYAGAQGRRDFGFQAFTPRRKFGPLADDSFGAGWAIEVDADLGRLSLSFRATSGGAALAVRAGFGDFSSHNTAVVYVQGRPISGVRWVRLLPSTWQLSSAPLLHDANPRVIY
jgi:hypothetical protein